MLKIIGKPTSINVRKVLWTCVELDLPFAREDWRDEHAALNPNRMVPVLVDGDFTLWESNSICRYLCRRARQSRAYRRGAGRRQRRQLEPPRRHPRCGAAGAYVAGERFTLADIVIGLSLNRWSMTPMARPDYPHVRAYLARLAQRPGYRAWCANGVP